MPKTSPARYSDPKRATRTRTETARIIGCAPNTITGMVKAGDLCAVAAGNRLLITVASIEAKLGRPIAELEGAAS